MLLQSPVQGFAFAIIVAMVQLYIYVNVDDDIVFES